MDDLAEAVALWNRIDWTEDDNRTDEMRSAQEIIFAAARDLLTGERMWICVEQETRGVAVSNLPGDKNWCYFGGKRHLPDCGFKIMVDALLQEGE